MIAQRTIAYFEDPATKTLGVTKFSASHKLTVIHSKGGPIKVNWPLFEVCDNTMFVFAPDLADAARVGERVRQEGEPELERGP